MEGKIVYATTTMVARDEYTREDKNRELLRGGSMTNLIRVGVSPVKRTVKRVKYKDANWML